MREDHSTVGDPSFDGAPDDEAAPAAASAEAAVRPRLTYPFATPPAAGQALEVAPGIYWLRMRLPFALEWINLYALEDGEGWALVDCGMALEETRETWRTLFSTGPEAGGLGVAGFFTGPGARKITRVIATHMHPDHIGLAGWLCETFGCPLFMTRLEYVTCRMLTADTGRPAPEAGVSYYRAAGWDEPALARYRERFGRFGLAVSPLPQSFVRLSDGEGLTIGAHEWVIVTGNGHSPEHACLHCPALNVVIAGDQVLPRISSNVSVHPTEPDADPLADWLNSCAKLRAGLPADILVLPAHNEPFYGLHTRLDALMRGHERSLVRLYDKLEGERRAVDLFGALFARAIGPDLLSMATGETLAHLNCLARRGLAQKISGEGGVDYWRRR